MVLILLKGVIGYTRDNADQGVSTPLFLQAGCMRGVLIFITTDAHLFIHRTGKLCASRFFL